MRERGSLPCARRDGLLEEAVGEELLLYDQESHTAHCLSPLAASVWQNCDGEHDLTGLAQLVGVSKDLVADALDELLGKDLLVAEPQLMQSTVPGESRREAIGRVARYGAAAAAGSMIVSATAAAPATASSGIECCQCFIRDKEICNCTHADTLAHCEEMCKEVSNTDGEACTSGELKPNTTCEPPECKKK